MSELLQYKCPSCGGQLEFDSTVQKMKCPYCGKKIAVESLSHYDEELEKEASDNMNWDMSLKNQWEESETEGMRVYHCDSCGGEIITEESTGASKCPYCDNPIVMKGNFKGDLRPDFIIPFKLDKKAAKNAYLRHLEGKRFLPKKVFKNENHIDEIKGIYVPFWLFDCDVDARIKYHGERDSFWSDRDYDYMKTEHYSVLRAGHLSFNKVPHDGSRAIDDTLMESIEPFNFDGAVDFQTAYLSGYLADKYTVSVEDCIPATNQRIKWTTESQFQKRVKNYNRLIVQSSDVKVTDNKVNYVLYPVWILNTTWRGKKYIFAMNGQTGKLVGDLPCDMRKYWLNFLGVGVLASLATVAISYLAWLVR